MKSAEVILYRQLRAQQDIMANGRRERRNLWFTFTQGDILPAWPCCYVIYHGDKLVYVGQTTNLAVRFFRHRQAVPKGSRLTVKVKLCRRFGEWATTEVRLISRLQPILNRVGIEKRMVA